MADDLERLKEVWKEVTSRKKEHFHYPEVTPPGTWPANYADILGITPGQSMAECPERAITKSAYLINHESARHVAMMAKAQELLGLQTPGQARELVARCPEIEHGLEPFYAVWQWFETTSGLYTSQEEETRELHRRLIPALISNLIWKLKMQARAGTQVTGDPEPLLNLETLREALVDIAYVPAWAKGSTSFYKKNIETETARAFSEDCRAKPTQASPYTYAAACTACNSTVVPGTLADHLKECTLKDGEGMRLRCKCNKEFKTAAALSQHRVLHCRRAAICGGCGEPAQQPCQCQIRRAELCKEIWNQIYQTQHGTGTIYDLTNDTAIVATTEELKTLIKTITDRERMKGEAPAAGVPTWKIMTEDTAQLGTWAHQQDLTKVEFPHKSGREESSTGTDSLPPPDQDEDNLSEDLNGVGDRSAGGNQDENEAAEGEVCQICHEIFPDLPQLLMHARSVHADPFRCQLCRAQHHTAAALMKHMAEHSICKYCDRMFFNEGERNEHEQADHEVFQCPTCGSNQESAESLQAHMQSQCTLTCQICEESHLTRTTMTMHMTLEHPLCKDCETRFDSVQDYEGHLPCGPGMIRHCGICTKQFRTIADFKEHLPACEPMSRRRRCDTCTKQFPTASDYKNHLPCGPAAGQRRCDTCAKQFPTASDYKNHLPCGPAGGHRRCGICAKQFRTVADFKEHLPCRGPNNIGCPLCPTTWPTKESLEQHNRTSHPKCNTCGRLFKTLGDYLTHNPCGGDRKQQRNRSPEIYCCEKCGSTFNTALELMEHDQRTHQRTPQSPQACVSCTARVEEQAYMDHIKQHTKLYQWNLKGLTCPKCPGASLESIAEALQHVLVAHRESFSGFTAAVQAEKIASDHLTEDQALVRAVRKAMGAEDDFKCGYENCRQIFFTAEELETHKKLHECKTCGFMPTNPRELADHEKQHGKARGDGQFPCTKCGQKLSTFEELTAHEDAHNKYSCARCKQKFSSTIEQNRHELTCGEVNGMDVFGAAASSDPTLVLAKCLQTMVAATETSLEPGTADLMRNQIKKAISTQSGKTTLRKNHNSQKTFTFIRSPPFQPSNTVTTYSDKDISHLKTCQFAGTGTPEENYTTLNDLVQNIARVVRARSLTRDIATDLLLQHLKSPAKDLANSYREEFELRFGSTAIPEFQDLLLYLETTFINIRPQHAREQLLALKRQTGESMTNLYIRAWRCSHFASFTEKEAERPRFRESLVKEAVMRNLAPKQRESVDQEELQRSLRDEAPMGPREIVDYLNNIKSQKEAMEVDRARPDFTTVGQLAAKTIRKTSNEGRSAPRGKPRRAQEGTTRRGGEKRTPRQRSHERQDGVPPKDIRTLTKQGKPNKPTPARRVETTAHNPGGRSKEDLTRREWIETATSVAGPDACWKCGRKGHGHKECRTYKVLTRRPCPTCRSGYHHPKACRKATADARPPRAQASPFQGYKAARYTWTKQTNQNPGPATGSNRVQPKGAKRPKGNTQDGRWPASQPDGRWPGKSQKAANSTQARKPFVKIDRVQKEQDLVERFLSELRGRP